MSLLSADKVDAEDYVARVTSRAVPGASESIARHGGQVIGTEDWRDDHRHWLRVRSTLGAARTTLNLPPPDRVVPVQKPPESTVLEGRSEVGMVGNDALVADTGGAPRVLLLGGRTWLVTQVDWKRRRCWVEATELPGRARWSGSGSGLSFAISRGVRDVVLGTDPGGVTVSRRDDHAVRGLKLSAALATELARTTVAERLTDREGARHVLREPRRGPRA